MSGWEPVEPPSKAERERKAWAIRQVGGEAAYREIMEGAEAYRLQRQREQLVPYEAEQILRDEARRARMEEEARKRARTVLGRTGAESWPKLIGTIIYCAFMLICVIDYFYGWAWLMTGGGG